MRRDGSAAVPGRPCRLIVIAALWITEAAEPIERGMSGSPVLLGDGAAVGVASISSGGIGRVHREGAAPFDLGALLRRPKAAKRREPACPRDTLNFISDKVVPTGDLVRADSGGGQDDCDPSRGSPSAVNRARHPRPRDRAFIFPMQQNCQSDAA